MRITTEVTGTAKITTGIRNFRDRKKLDFKIGVKLRIRLMLKIGLKLRIRHKLKKYNYMIKDKNWTKVENLAKVDDCT